jgi:poly-gamma-glutamate synthesis protein (capsule biosynthesis protein)
MLLLAALLANSPSPRRLTLAFVGDVMLGRDVAVALDGDWADAFAAVRPWLAGADLTFANLESPLTVSPFLSGRFDLRAPPEAIVSLTAAEFDLVSLANNHALDGGEPGLADTIAALDQAGIVALVDSRTVDSGIDGPESASFSALSSASRIYGNPHLRVSVFAFLDTGLPLNTAALARAAATGDLVMVSMHWGAEYYPPTERQRLLARELVAAGADLIIGHGPHVLQPVEVIEGALVAYSLGNFLFDQPFADTRQGAILRLTLERGSITVVEAIPTVIRRGRVHLASVAAAAAILDRLCVPTEH